MIFLSNLNQRYEEITKLIPDKRVFVDDFSYAKNEYGKEYDDQPLGNQFYKLSNGKYIWVGIDGSSEHCKNVRRYNSDFTLDESFIGPDFQNGNSGFVRGVAEQSDGKLIIVGHFGSPTNKIMRLNVDGSIDSTFSAGTGFNNHALVVKVLSDDSILVGGTFSSYNGNSVQQLAKLNSDGSANTSFFQNINESGVFDNHVYSLKIDNSGKIYASGLFTTFIVRLNSDGTKDESFDMGSGFNNRVTSIELDSNGKVIAGGWFSQYKGAPCNPGIVRLLSNGDLDNEFQTEGFGLNNTNGIVQCVAVQSDNKVLAGGWFNQYNGDRQGHIIRFNTDGSKDSSFNVEYGFNDNGDWSGGRVQHIHVTSVGDILCVGTFSHYNGRPLYGFAKINSMGILQSEKLFKYNSAVGISDGWDDMYDSGNFINTNLTQLFSEVSGDSANYEACIPYTHTAAVDESGLESAWENSEVEYVPSMDGIVVEGDDYFGEGSHYFTNMYPGMFVMVATGVNVEEFSVTGDLGSDGSSQNESSILVVHEGSTYTVFKKVNREGNGGETNGDPSVNHLIIIPGDQTGLSQLVNESGDDYDDHCVQGLSDRRTLAYIVIARHTNEGVGDWLSDSDAEAIVLKFLEVTGGLSGSMSYTFDLSPQWVRQVGEGSMDTAIVVEEGIRRSIQRSIYIELVDSDGNRKIEEVMDGEEVSDSPETAEVTNNPNGHPTFGENDRPTINEQIIPVGNPLAS